MLSDENTKANILFCGMIVVVGAVVSGALYVSCQSAKESSEFQQWCKEEACSGREVVRCDGNVKPRVAICKDTVGKIEVVFR